MADTFTAASSGLAGTCPATSSRTVLDAVADLVAAGALRPLVTSTYPLRRAPEALRLVEQGHARGKIVIEVSG